MSEPGPRPPGSGGDFVSRVGKQAKRRLRARRHGGEGGWFGLGMMGLVGWSIVVPTLLGAMLGQWLDSQNPDGRSWTLALLMAGLVLGCANAWHWVSNQNKIMDEDDADDAQ
ncbi:MAG: AtpZ/AtpI family protein [Devosia sp.]